MGEIKRLLALKELDREILTPYHFGLELCENVHYHRRNVRIDMSMVETRLWNRYFYQVQETFEQIVSEVNYVEGDHEFSRYFKTLDVPEAECHYFPRRLSIELQVDGSVHFHYRDLRLHLTLNEFLIIAEGMAEALEEYKDYAATPTLQLDEGTQKVPIKRIMAYDAAHGPGWADKQHRETIDGYKDDLLAGKKLDPIIIRPNGYRLQGFCRYIAHLELGYDEIECVVSSGALKGVELEGTDNDAPKVDAEGRAAVIIPGTGTPETQKHWASEGGILDLRPKDIGCEP